MAGLLSTTLAALVAVAVPLGVAAAPATSAPPSYVAPGGSCSSGTGTRSCISDITPEAFGRPDLTTRGARVAARRAGVDLDRFLARD